MTRNEAIGDLAAAVVELAGAMVDMTDEDLGQPYRWGAHDEGVRFALIGAMHELRALAVALAAARRQGGPALTRAHHALAQYHAAYRDLGAVLLGVSSEEYERPPATGEWPLRYVYGHMVGAERNFFALVHYGLRRQRDGDDAEPELPDGEANRLHGPFADFRAIMDNGTQAEMATYHATIHDRALDEFADITNVEIDGPSVWWEGEPYTLEYRLHRMDAHLRQHTIQVEKTLVAVRGAPNEARRLLRLVYNALAEVEGAIIGAPELGAAECAATAVTLRERTYDVVAAVERAHALIAAVKAGDEARIRELLAAHPSLANASDGGVPAVRLATYYGREAIAAVLVDAGAELEIWDAAALGRLDVVTEQVDGYGDWLVNETSHDGYAPLGLAAFFGHEPVARFLIARGANVNAVSQNAMQVQPIHSACAGNHTAIVILLLEAGANPNAVQQDSFRPLHAAAQNGNAAMVRLLLSYGADPALTDARGQTARDFALEGGHEAVAELLLTD